MFGIGGGEFIFIIFIILMFFGSDKIPEMARALGKGMAHLKNATNDIKSEIHNSAKDSGIDVNALTGGISDEITKAKEGFSKMVLDSGEKADVKSELDQVRDTFAKLNSDIDQRPTVSATDADSIEGPVKRQS